MKFATTLAACVVALIIAESDAVTDQPVEISTVSAQPDRISGGNVLVQISVSREAAGTGISVFLNRRDISSSFHSETQGTAYLGMVRDLRIGLNRIDVDIRGRHRASIMVHNFPAQGPIVSGPHTNPYICRTTDFVLVDGTNLGPPLDSDCSTSPRVIYLYMSTLTNTLTVLKNTQELPRDVAKTTTINGTTVNFIVRVETATVNRGIFESAVLYDPVTEPSPSPLDPPKGWNKVLLGIHGVGCPGGWYTQGGVALDIRRGWLLDVKRLSQGYAFFTNTLQNPSDSCNPFLAGETAMMSKERFVKAYGAPNYSLTMGVSGGAYTSLGIIDAFPGVFDGALIGQTFPDALSIALSGMDGHLLTHYFLLTKNPGLFTDEQQIAVTGYSGWQAWLEAANQAARTDPVPGRLDVQGYISAAWNSAVPLALRYDPHTNPRGARPTIWDISKNIYGIDPRTRFALRAYDNVGVQYGLSLLNAKLISVSQFLDLNENIGGFDRDDNYVRSRTSGDTRAIAEAYSSGVQLSGSGGLAEVPIVDLSGKVNEGGNYHYQWFHFATRERLKKANGDDSNFVLWRGDPTETDAVWEKAFRLLNRWVTAIKADTSSARPRDKIVANKPSELTDGCWDASGGFIGERQVFGREANTSCNALWPSYAFPRLVAGGPLAANILKCTLKPIDRRDYAVALTVQEERRLRHIFPTGVCDWSRKGSYFRYIDVGRSYGPAPSRSFRRD